MLTRGRGVPVLLALVAALMWGFWWAPIRMLEAAGLTGPWASLSMNLTMVPVILITMKVRRRAFALPATAIIGALAAGLAVTLYGNALVYTDVVRAVLLFYLAPFWSLAIECLFMGRRFRWQNALALLLSFAGIALIFRGDLSLVGWRLGDWMAIGSGLAWSAGTALIFTSPGLSARAISLVTAVGATVASLTLVALDPGGFWPSPHSWPQATGLSLISGASYVAPIILLTMWGALRLPPATLSFLLTAEIVSGVTSSAIFLDELFGWPEALGAMLIASAALIEVVTTSKPLDKKDK